MSRYHLLLATGIIISLFIIPNLYSQEINDPEAEYIRIKNIAFEGRLDEAIILARKLVNTFPSYGDARILLGRITAWQNDYTNAIAIIDTLLKTDPDNSDALSAKRDILKWLTESTPSKTEIKGGYHFDTFDKPYLRYWHIFSAGAGHKFTHGQASLLLNVGNFLTDEPIPDTPFDFQISGEAYPEISERNYAYVSYAMSPGRYFPSHRVSLEFWHMLKAGWVVSAGLNYYYFDRNVFITHGSVEKYIGRYWFSVKGFIYLKDEGPTLSGYINGRRYLNDNDYLQITLSTGTAPDEPFDIQADLMRLSAHAIRMAYNKKINNRIALMVTTGYSLEEYAEELWRNRFEGGLNIICGLAK